MTLRKVPGALVLGLLASLAAHGVLYGAGHAIGGSYHALLVQAGLAGGLALLASLAALAWTGAKGIPTGTVMAARLRDRLPGRSELLGAAAVWFGTAEAIEPHHASAGVVAVAIALVLVSWLVHRLAGLAIDVLAGAVISIFRAAFSARTPSWSRRPRRRFYLRRTFWARRRFARPPPIAIACA
ncbi:MAG: hypothetical protein JO104_10525 [Candidatus Eremiobacteraeota bacterium]|nr:hypothetical protein [Candidatus Eremiobacteraeota bacterium]